MTILAPVKVRLLPLLLASLVAAPSWAAEPVAMRAPGKLKAELRHDLLNKLRLGSDDPATCFLQEPHFEHLQVDAPVTDAEVRVLLTEILSGLEAHDDEQIRRATAELQAEQASEVDFFGSADHHMHPSTDLYEDPLKSYTSRPDLMLAQIDPRDFDYPIVLNEQTQNWMVYFLTRGRKWFTKWIARSARYEPLIKPRLREAGLPEDLFYQAMIESGFNPYATSHASAVGVWQFIQSTGKAYGLEQTWWIDERRDPVQATDAAIEFLTHLYGRFGDWKLASAAYNAGGGKISRAIKMYGTTDFWELSASHRSYLKPETKNYVPKIMAAAILSKYADRYGLIAEIQDEHRLSPWDFDVVSTAEATDISVIAEAVGMPLDQFEMINPALRRGYTPPGVANWPINVPRGTGEVASKTLAELPDDQRMTFVRHSLRRGETLGRIAGKYGVPVAAISSMNNISDPRRLRVGQTLLIPVRAEALGSRTIKHIVGKGESLSAIASRYGTSVDALRTGNKLSSDTLKIGQELSVQTAQPEPVVASSSSASHGGGTSTSSTSSAAASRTAFYTVQSGDSLSRIASLHKLEIDQLRSLNGFGSKTVIHPGDQVRVRPDPPKAKTRTYTVQSGDTLSQIASAHGISTSALKDLNGLKGDGIRVGQTLQVVGSRSSSGEPRSIKVESGDSLYALAQKHGVSVEDLRRWNALSGNTIRPGQTLLLRAPQVAAAPSTHTVGQGDTLSGIGARYGVSVSDLKRWNKLSGSTIKLGQRLTVRQ
jgi:membrane-bound lytic murein transglycosylase D